MQTPLQETDGPAFEFDPAWKPLPYFTIRPEPFGYLLCRYNWSVPVTPDTKPMIDAINGQTTLAQLHRRFGDEALDFVGHLYRERCIGFEYD